MRTPRLSALLRSTHLRRALAWLLGIALAASALLRFRFDQLAPILGRAGLAVLPFAAAHLPPLVFDTLGWRTLLDRARRPSLAALFLLRWAGESVNNLIPMGPIAGDIARALLAARAGITRVESAAAVATDAALGFGAELILALASIALLLAEARSSLVERFYPAVVASLIMLLGFAGALIAVERGAVRYLRNLLVANESWQRLLEGAADLDEEIRILYRRPGAMARGFLYRFIALLLGGGEIYLGLLLLGSEVRPADAIVVYGLTTIARASFFFVPAGLGVQEWSLLALGDLVGVSPEVALGLALLRRARELLFGLPGLLVLRWSPLSANR